MQQISLIPESAPFNDEQRAWLNGFLAGWLGLQDSAAASATDSSAATATLPAPPATADSEEPEDFPWHDPALPMDDRLQLTAGKPLARRLMAAMAQLDCGSCGYDCQHYAEALASGEEKSFTLCSPGGKPTSKKLKELFQLAAASNSTPAAPQNGHSQPTNGSTDSTWSRRNPFEARIRSVHNLNADGSAKQTSHVEIDLTGSGLSYDVGDSLGIYPTNCPELVEAVIGQLQPAGDHTVTVDGQAVPIHDALSRYYCLTEVTDELIALLSSRSSDAGQSGMLQRLLEDAAPIDGWDVFDVLHHHPSARLTAAELIGCLTPLKPRLYSISSSLKAHPDQVHLTVGRVGWVFRDRSRKGVASTMFADRIGPGDPVRVFVQKSHGFTVPQNPAAPAIMIGPGTGIAPFRAFLQERHATSASGRNWLFFGDQHAASDFLYRDEIEHWHTRGLLTKLAVAFSRDQSEKIYVQNRMLEHGAEFWQWLQDGAHVYVCGDAKRMAVDVDRALRQILAQFGGLTPQQVDDFVARLVKDKRYCRDVY